MSDHFRDLVAEMRRFQRAWFKGGQPPAERKTLLDQCKQVERVVDDALTRPEHAGHDLAELVRLVRDRQSRYWRGEKAVLTEARKLERALDARLTGGPQLGLELPAAAPVVGYGR